MEPLTPTAAAPATPPAPPSPVAPQSSSGSSSMLIGLIVGLIIGGAGGWYLGYMMKISPAAAQMFGLPMQQEESGTVQMQVQAEAETTAAPQNPLQDLETNPYADVKVNPFEE